MLFFLNLGINISFNMRYYFLYLICFIQSFAISQEEGVNRLSFTQLLEKIEETPGDTFILENTYVGFDVATDDRYNLFSYRFRNKPYPKDSIHIYKKLNFSNVTFQKNNNARTYGLVSFIFHEDVSFRQSKDISLLNCVFKKKFSFSDPSYIQQNTIAINNCQFNDEVSIADNGLSKEFSLILDNSIFINSSGTNYSVFSIRPILNINIIRSNFINIMDNRFEYDDDAFLIQITECSELYFSKNSIQSKAWSYLFLNDIPNLGLNHNKVDADLLFEVDKVESNYNMQWPITNKRVIPLNYIFYSQEIASLNNEYLDSIYDNLRDIDDLYYREELIFLSKFHTYFKAFHDRQSANNIYIKIKDRETERLAHVNAVNGTFSTYFELQTNRFLKHFSNYGTSPSKIVISSFKIILLFALFFLFSRNSWNKMNLRLLNRKIEQSVTYFTTDKNIVSAYDIDLEELQETSETRKVLKLQKKKIPWVFTLFTSLFLWFQQKRLKLKIKVWGYLNVVKNNWVGLSPFKRFINNVLFILVLSGYVIYKVVVLLINGLTLSINSFTTLGFGEIPIKGLGRYLAIIEGFIGWIFLTLFSVTLISQVLS